MSLLILLLLHLQVYKLTRNAQMKEINGMVQFAVEDPEDPSGGALIGALLKLKATEFIITVRSEMEKGMEMIYVWDN